MTERQLHEKRMEISQAIRTARLERQISQATLSEKTGLGIATIKRFESGKYWLGTKQLILICKSLDVKIKFDATL